MKQCRKNIFIVLMMITSLLLIQTPGRSEPQEDELFLVAEKAFDDGFYDVAMRYIEQFQSKFPDSAKKIQAKLLLGQCYYFKNQYLKAFDIFQELIQYTEFKDATLFWLGETYFKGGDYTQAQKNYEQLINSYANSTYVPQALYSLGWTFFQQNLYSQARDTFAKLITKFPSHQLSEEAAFKMGECSHNLGEPQKTIKIFQDFINLFPKSSRLAQADFYIAESYYSIEDYLLAVNFYAQTFDKTNDPKLMLLSKIGLGWSYLKIKKEDLSQKNFEEADKIAHDKNIPSDDVYLGLASVMNQTGNYEKAAALYEKLVQEFPNSPQVEQALLGEANCEYTLHKYQEAIQSYLKLIDLTSKNPEQSQTKEKAYYGLSWTYLKAGQTDQAISSFREIVSQSTNKIARCSALTQIGDAYQEINRLSEAIQIYDQILREYPDSVYADYAQFRQGIALLKDNKIEAAAISFQSLQANFPKSKYLDDVKYYLGLAYFKKSDFQQAIHILENYLTESKDKTFLTEAQYLLGLSNFNLKKYEPAIKSFQAVNKSDSDQKSVLQMAKLYLAKSLFNNGKSKEAIEAFNAIPQQYPGSEAAEEALIWLGDHYLDSSTFLSAIQVYELFVKSYPSSDKLNLVYYELGEAYQGANQLEKSLSNFKKITETDKEIYAKAKIAIADIFARDLDPQTAVTTYLNIANSVPEFKREAYLRIASLYKNNKDYAKAIDAYHQALDPNLKIEPKDAAGIIFELGDTYELLHDSARAIETYLKIPYLYPKEKDWVIKSYLRLARIFEDDSQWDQAQTIYQKIVDLGTDESKYAKERMDWIRANASKNQAQQND